MVSNGMVFNIPRAFRSSGTLDPNAAQNIKNAHAAGFAHVDVYFFPCPTCSKSAAQQAKEFADGMAGSKFGTVWLDIEASQYWHTDKAANQKFAQAIITALKSHGYVIGLYVNHTQWVEIFGSSFVGLANYNSNPSCADLQAFGPYTHFNLKQYMGTTAYCNGSVDMSAYC